MSMNESQQNLVGKYIESVDIIGQLADSEDNVVEADVMMELRRVGLCSLTVVTKARQEARILSRHANDLDQLDKGMIPGEEESPELEPYVINETSISTDLLDDKFLEHTVWQGLASCLALQHAED